MSSFVVVWAKREIFHGRGVIGKVAKLLVEQNRKNVAMQYLKKKIVIEEKKMQALKSRKNAIFPQLISGKGGKRETQSPCRKILSRVFEKRGGKGHIFFAHLNGRREEERERERA